MGLMRREVDAKSGKRYGLWTHFELSNGQIEKLIETPQWPIYGGLKFGLAGQIPNQTSEHVYHRRGRHEGSKPASQTTNTPPMTKSLSFRPRQHSDLDPATKWWSNRCNKCSNRGTRPVFIMPVVSKGNLRQLSLARQITRSSRVLYHPRRCYKIMHRRNLGG